MTIPPLPPVVPPVMPPAIPPTAPVMVKQGRRKTDWKMLGWDVYDNAIALFDMFKDRRHKWSMTRILWAVWTIVGMYMLRGEIRGEELSNAAWQAWTITQAAFSVCVVGPTMIDFWKGPAGRALSTMGGSLRNTWEGRDYEDYGDPEEYEETNRRRRRQTRDVDADEENLG